MMTRLKVEGSDAICSQTGRLVKLPVASGARPEHHTGGRQHHTGLHYGAHEPHPAIGSCEGCSILPKK